MIGCRGSIRGYPVFVSITQGLEFDEIWIRFSPTYKHFRVSTFPGAHQ